MRRHGAFHTIGQQRRLVGRGRRLALGDWLGLHDFENDALRQFHGNRRVVEDGDFALHVFLQVSGLIADNVLRHLQLFIVFLVHEDEIVAIVIEIGVVAMVDLRLFHLIGRLVTLGRLHPVRDAAHVDLRRGRALAREEAFRRQHDVKPPIVQLQNIAFTHIACDDLDHKILLTHTAASAAKVRTQR